MFRKYEQIIWLVKQKKVEKYHSIIINYVLKSKLIEIKYKKRALEWSISYLQKNSKKLAKKKEMLAIELIDSPQNQFYLLIPLTIKNKIQFRYINITSQIIKKDFEGYIK